MRRGKPWNYIALEIQKVHQNTSFCYLTSPFKLITKKQKQQQKRNKEKDEKKQNHSTQDSRVVPHRGTNWAALWLTAQIRRDAVLSESYGRGYKSFLKWPYYPTRQA
jgi:hypothetical protein